MNDVHQKELRKASREIKSLEEFKDIPQDVLENLLCEPFSKTIPLELSRRVIIVEIKKYMQIDLERTTTVTTTVVENCKLNLEFEELLFME